MMADFQNGLISRIFSVFLNVFCAQNSSNNEELRDLAFCLLSLSEKTRNSNHLQM